MIVEDTTLKGKSLESRLCRIITLTEVEQLKIDNLTYQRKVCFVAMDC